MGPGLAARRAVIQAARVIYEATPSAVARRLYFDAFCRVVRNRSVRSTLDGLNFELDLGEIIDVGLFLGRWEPDVTACLERFCRPGATVLDIGANVGAHTLRLARRVGKAGRVFAFEPTEFAFRKLLRNLALNDIPQVTPVQVALAARNRPGQHVDFRASWRTDGGRHDGPTVVDLVRLDDWWAVSGSGKPELVKIDVDGNEFGVLTAAGIFSRARCPSS